MTLVGLRAAGDQLRLAREFAVLGDYDTSRVYYQGVLSQVSRYARGPSARPAVGTLARASDARAARRPARVLTLPDPPPRSRPADTSTPWTGTKTRPTRTARYVFPHPRTPRVFEIRASSSRREKSLLETRPEVSTHKENRRVFLRAQSKWHRVRAQLADEFKSVSALDLERAVFSTRPGSDAAADRARAPPPSPPPPPPTRPSPRADWTSTRRGARGSARPRRRPPRTCCGARARTARNPETAPTSGARWTTRTSGARRRPGTRRRAGGAETRATRARAGPAWRAAGTSPRGRDGGTRSASGTPVVAAAGAEAPAARRRARGATAAIRNTRIAKPPGT